MDCVSKGNIAGEAGPVNGSCTEIFAVRHGVTDWNVLGKGQVVTNKDLLERHIGDLQGLTFSESPKVNPIAFEALKSPGNDQEISGGGESQDQLNNRYTSSLQRIAKKH